MKPKRLIFLVNLILILAVAGFAKKYWNEKQEARLAKEAAPKSDVLPRAVTPAFITRIEITSGGSEEGKIALVKSEGGDWAMRSHFNTRGAKWSIDDLIKNISLIQGEPRSDKPEVLGDFELRDDQAIHVRLWGAGNEEALHLLVSPMRPYGTQNFVRAADSPKVFMTGTDVLGALGIYQKGSKPDYKTFAHQQALKADISKISAIRLTAPNGSVLSLVKKTGDDKTTRWEFDPKDASEVDPAKVSEFLGLAVNLYGIEVLDPSKDYGFAAKALVSLTEEDAGKTVTTELFTGKASDAGKETQAIRSMPENLVWNTQASSVENLKKDRAFFVKAKPAETKPAS